MPVAESNLTRSAADTNRNNETMDRNDNSTAAEVAPDNAGLTRASAAREWIPVAIVTLISILALSLAWTPAAGSRGKQVERATTTSAIPGSSSTPTNSSARVRVQIFLTDNSIARGLDDKHGPLAGHMRGAAAAKREALTSSKRPTAKERLIARSMDNQRTAAMADLRRAAASGTRQSERVARLIKRLGGRVIDAPPLPNSIIALVPGRALSRLASEPAVSSIVEAPAPVWASSWTDGSETWHAAGFTGGGTSADGIGGPDYLAFDQGLTTAHQAFRTRLGGDSPTGPGSGATRVISPVGRTNFSGSGHGNNVAGIVASTDLTSELTGASPPGPASWQYRKGLAYGLDKLYDNYQAKSANRWEIGVAYQGEPGVSDIPEVINYSAGIYEDNVDHNTGWSNVDTEVSEYGITQTISAGNCGINPSIYTGCNGAPGENSTRRVSTPGNLFNAITLGGLTTPDIYNSATWTVWPNSSPGPTWGGRKKPDLISKPNSGPCPADYDVNTDTQLNDYDNCGSGTSYAAPEAGAGAILLASTGVYKPATQKAILINTATPIQGQTYWMPRSGWGALNLDGAFTHRSHYEDGFVTEAGTNSARFFGQNSVAVGDKTTLVWNRRATHWTGVGGALYMTLTNLDLFQFAAGDACSPNCTPTATGGIDANDTVDTDQTVTADNPMPGNSTDGSDNVEQVRSTATGSQIIKAKAISTIDGATEEPFSLAANHTLTALETPIPNVTLTATPATVGAGQTVTVSATVGNPSADLALTGAQVALSLPGGVTLTGGDANPKPLGTIAASGTTTATWQVTGAVSATLNLTATTTGTTYGESFTGQGADSFVVDADAPTPSVGGPGTWSTNAAPTFTWSATDVSAIASYDLELSRNGGAFAPLLTGTTSTSASVAGTEGETLAVRVRATDEHGNVSSWTTAASTTIDVVLPTVTIGTPSFPAKNTVNALISAANVGSPITANYSFTGASSTGSFAAGMLASFTNLRTSAYTTTLKVSATDELGRTVTAVRSIVVPSLYTPAALRLSKLKRSGAYVKVTGSLAKTARGRVTVLATPVDRQAIKRRLANARIKRGRFAAKLKLSPGKYRFTVTYAGSSTVLAAKVAKTRTVR